MMARVTLGMTVSLVGFINDRNGSIATLYPDLAAWRETQYDHSKASMKGRFNSKG
jgi:hypothetical protein